MIRQLGLFPAAIATARQARVRAACSARTGPRSEPCGYPRPEAGRPVSGRYRSSAGEDPAVDRHYLPGGAVGPAERDDLVGDVGRADCAAQQRAAADGLEHLRRDPPGHAGRFSVPVPAATRRHGPPLRCLPGC